MKPNIGDCLTRQVPAKPRRLSRIVTLFGGICIAVCGCGTTGDNPPAPRPNTGYVDFFTDSPGELSWEVKRSSVPDGEMKTVFSKFDPVEGTILRLATPPGNYRFQVWFMNVTTEGPQTAEVQVENGKVSPVHISLKESGTSFMHREVYGFRGSAKGYGHGTKIERNDTTVYRIVADAQPLKSYQPKERMPYFSAGDK